MSGMIELFDANGDSIYIDPDTIHKITRVGPSRYGHGVRSIVKIKGGAEFEVKQSTEQIVMRIVEVLK